MPNRQTRDQRIKDNLDLVEILGATLAGHDDDYYPYRDDMEGAGRLALVNVAAEYEGEAFRTFASRVVRAAMLQEAYKLDNTRRKSYPEPVDMVPLDPEAVPSSSPSEDEILGKIDRERSLDPGWRERERGFPEGGYYFRDVARMTPLDAYIWEERRVWNRPLGEVAAEIGMNPFQLRNRERRLVEGLTG